MQRLRLLTLAGLVASALFAISASARPNERITIRPGVGIGPINLGMTGEQVRRALGIPRVVARRRVIGGRPYTELEWGLGRWNVGLLGRPGSRRVVLVGTSLARHRTPEGIGIGSTDNQVWRALRGMRDRVCPTGTPHWYLLRSGTETIFFSARYENVVIAVEVRASPTLGCSF
jgi:hypothetical protein